MWQPTIVWVFPFKLSEKCLTDPIWVPQIYWQTGTLYPGSIKKTMKLMDVCWIKSLHSSKFPLLFKIAVWNVCHMHDLVFCQQMQKGIIGEFSIPICPCFPRRLPCYVFCICLLTYTNRYQKYKSVELGDQLQKSILISNIRTQLPTFQRHILCHIFQTRQFVTLKTRVLKR